MTRPQVRIPMDMRKLVLTTLVDTLRDNGTEVIIAALDGTHLHLLGRFREHDPREQLRWAKMRASQRAKAHASFPALNIPEGKGLWALRSPATPVVDRAHQLQIFRYVRAHEKSEGLIWDFRSVIV